MDKAFELHSRLAADTVALTQWPLCEVRLMNDAQYPWVLLIPRRSDIREIYQLNETDQQQLWRESAVLGQWLMEEFKGDKLNVAALGNQVPQLHLHHIVRYEGDACWPAPVWGQRPNQPYSSEGLHNLQERLAPLGDAFSGGFEL
ncbi:HIT family protein [Marinobacteraceae bacterium S3BR75-40.1]